MTQTKVSAGDVVTVTAPAGGVVSGVPVLIGALFVIPIGTVAAGELFGGYRLGEHRLPAVSGTAATAGAQAYWDDTNDEVTPTASGNTLIGAFTQAKASAATEAVVVLSGA